MSLINWCYYRPYSFDKDIATVISARLPIVLTNLSAKILPHRFRVELEVIAIKKYSKHSRCPELEPHYQMQFSVIPENNIFKWESSYTSVEDKNQRVITPIDRVNIYTERQNDRVIGNSYS